MGATALMGGTIQEAYSPPSNRYECGGKWEQVQE